jgi:hypothetical protein
MPSRSTRERIAGLTRAELRTLSERLIDALGQRLTHKLVANSPVDAPNDHVQLDLYTVDVQGITSDLAEAAQSLLLADSNQHAAQLETVRQAAEQVVQTIPSAARADFIDGAFCARLITDTVVAVRQAFPDMELAGLTQTATDGLAALGEALNAHPVPHAFDEFIGVMDGTDSLLSNAERRSIVNESLSGWSGEVRARLAEDWLRERSAWSEAAALVAFAWSRGAEDELERQRVTSSISIYLAESTDVPLMLGDMHGRAGAIEEARYWLGEGQNRFPGDSQIEKALQRWT